MNVPDSRFGILQEGRSCCAVAQARRASLLIDGEAYFAAFAAAAEQAERSILILAWDVNSRMRLTFGSHAPDELGPFLNWLVRRRRRLNIHVLDWDYPMVFGQDREIPPIYGFDWRPARRVHLRYDDTHPPSASHHQKVVVIDDRLAFVGGLDLTDRRWDTSEHRPDEPRRTDAGGDPYPPFHDAMLAVDSECARRLGDIARRRWFRATGERLAPVDVASDPWPAGLVPQFRNVPIGIACTTPADGDDPGVREVEQLYLDMIGAARSSIYIENQYFTSDRVGNALAARLAEPDGPEVVVVSRLLSHGWLEEVTMHVLRAQLVRRLREADRYGRFGIFYPDVPGLPGKDCIDVHSKVMVIDDQWLRVGSSNLSNRSMRLDTECDLVIEARGDPDIAAGILRALDQLLGEHLGIEAAAVRGTIERAGSIAAAMRDSDPAKRCCKPLDDPPAWSEATVGLAGLADLEKPASVDALVDQLSPPRRGDIRPAWSRLAVAAGVVLALLLAWRFTSLAEYVSAENAVAWADRLGHAWWAPVAIVAAYTPAAFVMFPRPVITLAAVVAFGAWAGFVYAMTGILLAALVTYLVGTLLERDTVRRIAGSRLNRLMHALRLRGLLAVTAVRFLPLAPFAVEGVVAGAIRIRVWHFLLGTFIGMLPGVLTATVFGNEITAALVRGYVNWWLVALAASAFLVVLLAVRRWLARTTGASRS